MPGQGRSLCLLDREPLLSRFHGKPESRARSFWPSYVSDPLLRLVPCVFRILPNPTPHWLLGDIESCAFSTFTTGITLLLKGMMLIVVLVITSTLPPLLMVSTRTHPRCPMDCR